MDVFSLLEGNNEDLLAIRSLLRDKNFEAIYDAYAQVISDLFFIDSKDEFDDLIHEEGEIEEGSFLLSVAAVRGQCCKFGLHEEGAGERLQHYVWEKSHRIEKFDYMDDDLETFSDVIRQLNSKIKNTLKQYIVLFDDTYSEGSLYVFYVDERVALEEWESLHIERIV